MRASLSPILTESGAGKKNTRTSIAVESWSAQPVPVEGKAFQEIARGLVTIEVKFSEIPTQGTSHRGNRFVLLGCDAMTSYPD